MYEPSMILKDHNLPLFAICENSVTTQNVWIFRRDFKCYNFLRVQRRHNCSPAASFADCVMTL